MISMKDVANLAGVSMITVSRVINSPELVKPSTREKVEKAIKDLNFRPNPAAKALAEKSTRAIHLYIPEYNSISEPFIMQLIAGVSEELSNAYYLLLIRRALEFNQKCDGVIVMGLQLNEEANIKEKFDVPIILFGKSDEDIDCIDVDNTKGAYKMIEYMIKLGHKRIGYLLLKTDQKYSIDRLEGYKKALKDNGIEYDEKLVKYIDSMEKDSYKRSLELIEEEKPTALFCFNDFVANATFRAATKLGLRVPEDISIAGYDGLGFDRVAEKPITTMQQPVYRIGKMLVARLLERLKNQDMPCEKILIEPDLILRNTVARI